MHRIFYKSFVSILCLLAIVSNGQAQYWQKVASFDEGFAVGFTSHSTLGLVAVSSTGEVKNTNDGGITWNSLTSDLSGANAVTTDAYINSIVYAATSNGVWRTSDGKTWTDAGLAGKNVKAIDIVGIANVIVAGTTSGVYLSQDRGKTWESFNTGLASTNIQAVAAAQKTYIYAGTPSGVFSYTDGDDAWKSSTIGNADIRVIYENAGTILIGTKNALYSNTTKITNVTITSPVSAIAYSSPYMFVGTHDALHYKGKDGKWTVANDGIEVPDITALRLAAQGSEIYVLASSRDGAIYRSIKPIGSLLGVEDVTLRQEFSLFPNPAEDETVLRLQDDVKLESLSIMDMTGRSVLTIDTKLGDREVLIPTKSLPTGAYVLVIRTSNAVMNKRIIVSR